MTDEQQQVPIDAEDSTRARKTGPVEHLEHLLGIGYEKDSFIVQWFVSENSKKQPSLSKKLHELISVKKQND